MHIRKDQPEYNLSDLTSVAVQTVQDATRLAKRGYSQAIRDALEEHQPWTKGWFAEGIAQGLYFHDVRSDNDFEHTRMFLDEDLDRVCKIAAYVGMGLAIANSGVFSESLYDYFEPIDRSWIFDGVGFYQLMFAKEPIHSTIEIPTYVADDKERRNAYHSGVGRGLWFALGEAQLPQLLQTINNFPIDDRPAIWRGVGFASTYAGGSQGALARLKAAAGGYVDYLQIGCVVAIVEQGKEEVPHRANAAKEYIGKGIGEIADIVSTVYPSANGQEAIATRHTSEDWMKTVLGALQ